jgi:hypothetical protein
MGSSHRSGLPVLAALVGVLAVFAGPGLAAPEVDLATAAAVGGCDFSMNVTALSRSLSINFFTSADQCYVQEGCLAATTGTRTLLRFDTRIDNIGTQDCIVGERASRYCLT